MRPISQCIVSLALLVTLGAAQDPQGTYAGTIRPNKAVPQIPAGGLPIRMVLEGTGAGLAGTLEVAGSRSRLHSVQRVEDGWTARSEFMGVMTHVELAVQGDELTGRLAGGGFTVEFEGQRVVGELVAEVESPSGPRALDRVSDEDWLQDLEFLEKAMPARHLKWYEGLSAARWTQAVQAVREELGELDGTQTAVRFASLVTLRGDAHTTLSLAELPELAPLGMSFEQFPDGVFVVRAATSHREAVGSRVVRVGDTPIEEVLARLATVRASENSQWKRGNVQLLRRPGLLRALGVSRVSRGLPLVLERGGVERELVVSRSSEAGAWVGPFDGSDAPLWRTRGGESYWFTDLEDGETLYFAYNRCQSDPSKPFPAFAARLVDAVESRRPQRLVIDLRRNGGGNSLVLEPVIDWLAGHPVLNHPSRLFVATGKNTFSSAMLNTVQLSQRTGATLIGEPTGGKPNGYGEILSMRLPRSGLAVWYSTKYFRMVPGDPPMVDPDRLVELTAADYFAGRDPVLDAVRSVEPEGRSWSEVETPSGPDGVWRGAFGSLAFTLAVQGEDAALQTVLHPTPLDARYGDGLLEGSVLLPGSPDPVPVRFRFGTQTLRASMGGMPAEGHGFRLRGHDPRELILQARFESQAVEPARQEEARKAGEELVGFWRENAEALNLLAWRLLTGPDYGNRFDGLALSASRRSNELTGQADWRHLETLALALFQGGEVQRAVEVQRRCLERVGDDPRREEVEEALRRYESGRPGGSARPVR